MLWTSQQYGISPSARSRMTRLAADLRAARVYTEPPVDGPRPALTDRFAVNYLAGFFSGEGSFALCGRKARFVIKLRRDDRPLLDAFCRDFGIGSVVDVAAVQGWSPAAVWRVTAARDVLRGIELFDSVPLLGRKARQYQAWRPGAQAIAAAIIDKSPLDARVVEDARRALAHATAYRLQPRRYVPSVDCQPLARRTFACSSSGRILLTDNSRAAHMRWHVEMSTRIGRNAKRSRRCSAAGTTHCTRQA
jgi:hypothetical protein